MVKTKKHASHTIWKRVVKIPHRISPQASDLLQQLKKKLKKIEKERLKNERELKD